MSDDDWTWELASKAQDDLAALDRPEQERILDKLDEIAAKINESARKRIEEESE
jgi:phage-related protein